MLEEYTVMSEYRICNRCIMDTTSDPKLKLDEHGVCNYCHEYDKRKGELLFYKEDGERKLKELFDKIKEECKNDEYDCALGISGGVDSSFLLHLCKKYDMRVLAIHIDAGWNSEIAVRNIESICSKCGYDLHTVVIDWPTMKELQRAYLFSGMGNMDVPQDHCFAAAMKKICKKMKIKYIFDGWNLATEGILSHAYQQSPYDWTNIKAIYKSCGRGKISLRKYPHMTFMQQYFWYPYIHPIKTISPLLYIDYSKKSAIELLESEYGWKYYGGKHYESRFTKFFQEVYLPKKYGWEKRRDHISSLIVGGEMTREEGLDEMLKNVATEMQLRDETEYVLKKLDISMEEWKSILDIPNRAVDYFPNEQGMVRVLKNLKDKITRKGTDERE